MTHVGFWGSFYYSLILFSSEDFAVGVVVTCHTWIYWWKPGGFSANTPPPQPNSAPPVPQLSPQPHLRLFQLLLKWDSGKRRDRALELGEAQVWDWGSCMLASCACSLLPPQSFSPLIWAFRWRTRQEAQGLEWPGALRHLRPQHPFISPVTCDSPYWPESILFRQISTSWCSYKTDFICMETRGSGKGAPPTTSRHDPS